jgi:hypothetical protein
VPFSNSRYVAWAALMGVFVTITLSLTRASRNPGPGVRCHHPTPKSGRRCFSISGFLDRRSFMRVVNPSRVRRCISESLKVTECSRLAARSSVVRNLR